MIEFLKDLIAPKKCYSCNKEWHFLCEKCFLEIEKKYYFDELCYVCKKYSKNFLVHNCCKDNIFYDKTIILTHYKIPVIKKLIKDFKFYYKKDISEDLWELLTEKMIKYKHKKTNIHLLPKKYVRIVLCRPFCSSCFLRGFIGRCKENFWKCWSHVRL